MQNVSEQQPCDLETWPSDLTLVYYDEKHRVFLGSLAAALRAPRLAEPLDLVASMKGEDRDRRPRLRSKPANWGEWFIPMEPKSGCLV